MTRAQQLAVYLQSATRPFEWRAANCCHFAAGWVELVEGRHPMAGLDATDDAEAAMRLVRRLGGLEAAWTRQLARPAISVALARLGDVVLLPLGNGRFSAGVCNGRLAAFVDEHGAVVFRPTLEAVAAWRVGA